MRTIRLAIATLTLAALTAKAEDFTGTFTGAYFSGWTTLINDNPVVTQPSALDLQTYSLTLNGASSPSLDPVGTASVIEFTHPVVGTGPTTISFSSLFYAEVAAHTNDSAAFLVNGAVRQDLSTISVPQELSFTLNPGDVFGWRLTSDNDNVRDVLQITATAVPEPGAAVLAVMGGMLVAWRAARRRG